MKKILLTLIGLAAGVSLAQAQGYIDMVGTAANITTNTSSYYTQGQTPLTSGKAYGGGTAPFGFDYALLDASTSAALAGGPTNSGVNIVGFNGGGALDLSTNGTLAGSVAGDGGSGGVQINISSSTAVFWELVGWSANLGSSLSTIQGDLNSGTWTTSNSLPGYFGFVISGSASTPGSTPGGAGDPSLFTSIFSNGSLVLYQTPIPEPTTLALAGLGGLSMLFLRRRKS